MATRTGGGIALAFLVLLIAAGAGGGTGGDNTAADGLASGTEGDTARARDRSTARVVQNLQDRGLEVEQRGVDADGDCAAHSYGQVRESFVRRPCTALYRALFEVRDGPATAVLAVAWVDMPDAAEAREFQRLVDVHGTGNATELTEEGTPPTSLRWTGAHYASVRDGVTVLNAQAEPVGRDARAVELAETAASVAVG